MGYRVDALRMTADDGRLMILDGTSGQFVSRALAIPTDIARATEAYSRLPEQSSITVDIEQRRCRIINPLERWRIILIQKRDQTKTLLPKFCQRLFCLFVCRTSKRFRDFRRHMEFCLPVDC